MCISKRLLSVLVCVCVIQALKGQTDVSNTFISNAGFNTSCNYLSGGSETVGTTNTGNVADIDGWQIESSTAWTAAATFEFGWNGTFNGAVIPASGAEGTTGSGQGVLALTAGWSGTAAYSQEITLPPGIYSLDYAVLFLNANEINANLVAWLPNEGDAVVSDLTTVPTAGQWVHESIQFTLKNTTTGTIRVGMQAFQSTSTDNARVFFDYIKLISLPADKTDLQALVNTANGLLANRENVPSGSTAYDELETEVATAQAILDEAAATAETVFNEEAVVAIKIKAVQAAQYAYTIQGATIDNPVNISDKIQNRDFEANGGSTVNWTTGLGIYKAANTVFNTAPNPNNVMDGDPTDATVGYQTINNLPTGIYKVQAVARGRAENGARMYISGEAGDEFGSDHRVSVEVDRIGDVGGSLSYGFNSYETPYVVLPKGIYDLTLGIYFEGDCGWSSVDNFELLYCGSAEPYINELKAELTVLTESTYLPSGYDLSTANALLNTEFTDENSLALSESLTEAIQNLEKVISDFTSPLLSDILIDGVSLRGFSSTVEAYDYTIYSSSSETPDAPTITAIPVSQYAAEPNVVDASIVPGRTSITVTSGNGAKKTYTIDFAYKQIDTYVNYYATVETLQNKEMQISGKGQITITGGTNSLQGSLINMASSDAWIYFPNLRPSEVVSGPLQNIKVYGEDASVNQNIRVAQYQNGAMVIPHSNTYEPLTVYAGSNLTGEAMQIPVSKYYKTLELGKLNDNIESFTLERGYMATFASNSDGTGISRVYIADKNSITVKTMPDGLSNTASFVVIRPWRWVNKKSWRGGEDGALRFNTTSRYDYNNSAYSTLDVEYVPMRHNPGWNAYSNFLDKFSSTHALGYNEPDNSVDDGYSPLEDAIEAWPNMMASGLRLGSPAVTDGGLNWLYGFIDECDARNWRVDFVAWHFYRSGYTASGLYNALKAVHERTGRPIWVTEFNNGCNWTYSSSNPVPSIEQNGDIIESFIEMMDTCSFIERYFVWDGCNEELRMTNSGNGNLYPAGVAYQGFESSPAFSEDFYNDKSIYDSEYIEISPSEIVIAEAEEYTCTYNGVVESDNAGYSGTGYLNGEKETGSVVSFKIMAEATSTVQMGIRYANGGTADRPVRVLVNGTEAITSLSMPVTGWSNYQHTEASIKLTKGLNEITMLAHSADGFANLDYYYLHEGARFVSCQPVTQEISLAYGWNLISINVVPDDNTIESVFSGLAVESIRTMDAFWQANQPGFLNSLRTIEAGQGYFVYMNTPGLLSVSGEPMDGAVTIQPNTETWQLIGVPYQTATPFSGVLDTKSCEIIKNFDGYWIPDGNSHSIDSFEPGKAYFVK